MIVDLRPRARNIERCDGIASGRWFRTREGAPSSVKVAPKKASESIRPEVPSSQNHADSGRSPGEIQARFPNGLGRRGDTHPVRPTAAPLQWSQKGIRDLDDLGGGLRAVMRGVKKVEPGFRTSGEQASRNCNVGADRGHGADSRDHNSAGFVHADNDCAIATGRGTGIGRRERI